MKKFLKQIIPGVLGVLLCTGCDSYDDSSLWGKVNEIDDRVTALETLCGRLNTEITSIRTILDAIQANDQIKSVIPIHDLAGQEIGYEIEFVNTGKIIIYHGQDGKDGINGENGTDGVDGQTPIVSIASDTDGILYWTINGQWLLDYEGNKIKAEGRDGTDGQDGKDGADGKDGKDGLDGNDGALPRLKIED